LAFEAPQKRGHICAFPLKGHLFQLPKKKWDSKGALRTSPGSAHRSSERTARAYDRRIGGRKKKKTFLEKYYTVTRKRGFRRWEKCRPNVENPEQEEKSETGKEETNAEHLRQRPPKRKKKRRSWWRAEKGRAPTSSMAGEEKGKNRWEERCQRASPTCRSDGKRGRSIRARNRIVNPPAISSADGKKKKGGTKTFWGKGVKLRKVLSQHRPWREN